MATSANMQAPNHALLTDQSALTSQSSRGQQKAVLWIMGWYLALSWLTFASLLAITYVEEGTFGFAKVDGDVLHQRSRRWWVSSLALATLALAMGRLIAHMPTVRHVSDAAEEQETFSDAAVEGQMQTEAQPMELEMLDCIAARRLLRKVGSKIDRTTHKLTSWIKIVGYEVILYVLLHVLILEAFLVVATDFLAELIKLPLLLDQEGILPSIGISLAFAGVKFASKMILFRRIWRDEKKEDGLSDHVIDRIVNNASYGALLEHMLNSCLFAVQVPMNIFLSKSLHAEKESSAKLDTLVHASFLSYLTTVALGQAMVWIRYWYRRFRQHPSHEIPALKLAVAAARKKLIKLNLSVLANDPVVTDFAVLKLGATGKRRMQTEAMTGGFDLGKEVDNLVFAVVYPVSMATFNPSILLMAASLLPLILLLTLVRWRLAVTPTQEMRNSLHRAFAAIWGTHYDISAGAEQGAPADEEHESMDSTETGGIDLDSQALENNDIDRTTEGTTIYGRGARDHMKAELLRMCALPSIIFFCAASLCGFGAGVNVVFAGQSQICTDTMWKHLCVTWPMMRLKLSRAIPALLGFYALEAAWVYDRNFDRRELQPEKTLPRTASICKKLAAADRFDRSLYANVCSSVVPVVTATALVIDRCAASHVPVERWLCRCLLRVVAGVVQFVLLTIWSMYLWFLDSCAKDLYSKYAPTSTSPSLPDAMRSLVVSLAVLIGTVVSMCLVKLVVLVFAFCVRRLRRPSSPTLPQNPQLMQEYRINMVVDAYAALKAARVRCTQVYRPMLRETAQNFPSSDTARAGFNDAWGAANLRLKVILLRDLSSPASRSATCLKYFSGGQVDYLAQLLLPQKKGSPEHDVGYDVVWSKVWREACRLTFGAPSNSAVIVAAAKANASPRDMAGSFRSTAYGTHSGGMELET